MDSLSRYGHVANFLGPRDDPETPVTEGGVNGDTINFYIEGFFAGSFTFEIGGTDLLPLNVDIALPVVTTAAATDITSNSATLNGSLDDLGDYTTLDVSLVWGTTPGGPYPNETTPEAMTSTGSFNAGLAGLPSNTTYYFRTKATGSVTVYGN